MINNTWEYTDPEFLTAFLTFFERHQNTILLPLSKCRRTLHQLKCIMTVKDRSIDLSWLILVLSFGQQSQQKFSMPDLHSTSRPTQHNPSHESWWFPHFYTEHFFLLLCLQILSKDFRKWAYLAFALPLLSYFQKSTFKVQVAHFRVSLNQRHILIYSRNSYILLFCIF